MDIEDYYESFTKKSQNIYKRAQQKNGREREREGEGTWINKKTIELVKIKKGREV